MPRLPTSPCGRGRLDCVWRCPPDLPRAELREFMRDRRLVLIGESNMRQLAGSLTGMAGGMWKESVLGCSSARGFGCPDCNDNCLEHIDETKDAVDVQRHNYWHDQYGYSRSGKNLLTREHYHQRHKADTLSHSAELNATFIFSWKPELAAAADVAAFEARWCVDPPDAFIVHKGNHEMYTSIEPTDEPELQVPFDVFRRVVAERAQRFASLFACPALADTPVVYVTPFHEIKYELLSAPRLQAVSAAIHAAFAPLHRRAIVIDGLELTSGPGAPQPQITRNLGPNQTCMSAPRACHGGIHLETGLFVPRMLCLALPMLAARLRAPPAGRPQAHREWPTERSELPWSCGWPCLA